MKAPTAGIPQRGLQYTQKSWSFRKGKYRIYSHFKREIGLEVEPSHGGMRSLGVSFRLKGGTRDRAEEGNTMSDVDAAPGGRRGKGRE